MKISDILDETSIRTQLPGSSKDEIILEMIDIVAASKKVLDKEKVKEAIFEREKIMSTGVGNGFAIPMERPMRCPILWLRLRSPQHRLTTNRSMNSLSAWCSSLSARTVCRTAHQIAKPHLAPDEQEEFRKNLLAAASPKEVLEIFRTEEAMYFDN